MLHLQEVHNRCLVEAAAAMAPVVASQVDGLVDAGQVADTQAKDPFLLGPRPVDAEMHCNKTAESPAMAEAEFGLRMDEKELATSEEVAKPDEVGEATELSAVATEAASTANVVGIGTSTQAQPVETHVAEGDASTVQPDLQEEERANEPDSQSAAPARGGQVATADAPSVQQDQQQEERANEPDSQSVAPAQEGPASADFYGIDGSLTAPQESVIAETRCKSDADAAADKIAAPGGG